MFPSSLPMSNRMKKKMLKKTSYQKTKEEFESTQEKRKQKKEVTCSLYHLLLIITLGEEQELICFHQKFYFMLFEVKFQSSC